MNTFINWLVSALVLWGLSWLPFMAMSFRGWVSIVIVAVVLGLINAIIVPIVKGLFKGNRQTSLLIVIISVIVDAGAIWLASVLVGGFTLGNFFPTAIIAAVVLALINGGFSTRD